MQGIYFDSQYFQCQTLTLIWFTINLHRHWRKIVKSVIKRGHRINHPSRHETIVLRLLFEFLPIKHLYTRCDIFCWFELWELHLRTLLGRSRQRNMCLLADKDLDRVNNSLYRYLRFHSGRRKEERGKRYADKHEYTFRSTLVPHYSFHFTLKYLYINHFNFFV